MTESLAQLVSFNTVAVEGLPSPENPVHQGFKQELARQADQLGLDFSDYGYVVVIGLGQSNERLGLITHGDVQPADPSKWAKSPFELDATSEPGILLARGAEDDKGPISNAMYAMKAIKDKEICLKRRIELYVYMAEESDWAPLEAFVKTHPMPQLNITIDANYPVVTAEKGYGTVKMTFPNKTLNSDKP
jgi:dipeptidase D